MVKAIDPIAYRRFDEAPLPMVPSGCFTRGWDSWRYKNLRVAGCAVL